MDEWGVVMKFFFFRLLLEFIRGGIVMLIVLK